MSTTYRIDYVDHAGHTIVIDNLTRATAQSKARTASAKHGSAYAIRTDYGQDVGQKVYDNGTFSHQDDVF